MAEEQNRGQGGEGQETPPPEQQEQQQGSSDEAAALKAQLTQLQQELEQANKKADQAVSDAGKGRDRLRQLMAGVQEVLGMPGDEGKGEPWETRIGAVQKAMKEQQERVEALEADLQAAQGEREAAKLAALRTRIGAEMGLPTELINRLQGETEAQIRKDAETLQKAMPRTTAVSPTNPADGGKGAIEELAQRLYARNRGTPAVDLFTPEGNEAAGGGVGPMSGEHERPKT